MNSLKDINTSTKLDIAMAALRDIKLLYDNLVPPPTSGLLASKAKAALDKINP